MWHELIIILIIKTKYKLTNQYKGVKTITTNNSFGPPRISHIKITVVIKTVMKYKIIMCEMFKDLKDEKLSRNKKLSQMVRQIEKKIQDLMKN